MKPFRYQLLVMTRFPFASTGFFTCLLAVWSVPVALGQAVPRKPFPKEPLEKLENPPALYGGTGVSPRIISQYEIFTSSQVNVNGSEQNITGDAANEPSICVDPTSRNKMSIGWRQFNSITSNFRQAGWAYTSNGGTSWRFPGVLENNVFRSDPVLNADSTGKFFYLSLLETFFDDMWRSLNGAMSWTNIAPARGGDKQWFTIDNTNSTGHGFQYQCWSTDGNNYGGRQFTRSTDGGFTWLNPINIPNSPTWGTLDVDTNGNLFIAGVNQSTGQIWCIRSSNAKNGAITPSFDQSTLVNLGGDIDFDEPINPVGLVGQLYLAVDRSGTSTNNNVYMLASVLPTSFTIGSDVMFVRSTNGGRTFSAPRRINDDPVNHAKWHWFGAHSVAPNGRLDAIWLDTRNAANNTNSQLFYSYSMDGGNTWAANVAVSNSFSPFLGYPNQNKMGDYMSIVSDNAGANVAYCATFNGEQDIYYVRVAPAPAPTDFNNDGHPDFVLYNASTHQTVVWYMNNNVHVTGSYGPTLPAGWSVASVADFNRDGHPDYLLFNPPTRQTVIWYLSGATFLTANHGPTLPSGWELMATGDFNRDGKPDFVLYKASTRQTVIWYMNNNVHVTGAYGPTLPAGWSLVAVADFNGDGHPDYLLLNASTRQTVIWYMNNNVHVTGSYGPTLPAGWSLVGAADFDGNGRPDYLLYNSSTHQTAIWYMNNNVRIGSAYGPTISGGWSLVAP
jgi:hypothetical protein